MILLQHAKTVCLCRFFWHTHQIIHFFLSNRKNTYVAIKKRGNFQLCKVAKLLIQRASKQLLHMDLNKTFTGGSKTLFFTFKFGAVQRRSMYILFYAIIGNLIFFNFNSFRTAQPNFVPSRTILSAAVTFFVLILRP